MENYKVNDIIPNDLNNLRILFIFESPYKQELINGFPVAGGSGKTVSKFLHKIDSAIPDNLPFGEYMSFFKDPRFGIANCSNYPMDKAAYEVNVKVPYPPEDLDIIRKKLTSTGKVGKLFEDTYLRMRTDFVKRINSYITNEKVLIVLCGKIASNFFKDSEIKLNNPVIAVPHPSRNQWVYKNYAEIMNKLKIVIHSLIS